MSSPATWNWTSGALRVSLAEKVEYVREYQGERLPEGKKSVSFRVVAGAPDRTLSSDEITALREQIIAGMKSLGYELRV